MAQQLKAYAAIVEYPGLVPSTYTAVHNHLNVNTFFWIQHFLLYHAQTHVVYIHTYMQTKAHTHKIKVSKILKHSLNN